MNKIIAQDIQNDKQIYMSIKRFFKRFCIALAPKSATADKTMVFLVAAIF